MKEMAQKASTLCYRE